jgi:uncharacterized metal-binding protein
LNCATCEDKECYDGKDCTGLQEKVEKLYKFEDINSMKISASIEAQYYMKKTRLEELMLYAKEMGYNRLGLAFCVGLAGEAKILHKILSKNFEVHSVCCKVCGIDKDKFELARLHPEKGIEATCNPLGQAMVLNKESTDLNIILGLCIGHDILFTKYSEAPVTTFAVKDRILAHNPLGAIYSNYYLENVFQITKED